MQLAGMLTLTRNPDADQEDSYIVYFEGRYRPHLLRWCWRAEGRPMVLGPRVSRVAGQ